MKIYIIGSLRNEKIPIIANRLREHGHEVFDDWYAPGPNADDYWKEYEKNRGRGYLGAIQGWAAKHIFEFDKFHLDTSDAAVMVYPAGKSAHLEFGYIRGQRKPGFILLDTPYDPDRWDIMLQFATGIFEDEEKLIEAVNESS